LSGREFLLPVARPAW